VQFLNTEINHQVLLQHIDGQHAINEELPTKLICLSSNLSLKQFIGSQVAVDQGTDLGQLFRTTGIIT